MQVDFYRSNNYYSQVGGITLRNMNLLELEFLNLCDFNIFINDSVFSKYRTILNGKMRCFMEIEDKICEDYEILARGEEYE